MKRKFKLKKRKLKIIFHLLLLFFAFYIFLGIIFNGKVINIKEILMNSAFKEIINEDNYFIKKLNINLTTPKNILYISLNNIIPKKALIVFSSDEETDLFNYENSLTDYVEDPNPIEVEDPIVYIYNTHQLEEYNMKTLYDYSIKPNVMIASYIIKEKLNNYGIPSIVETANIKEYLDKNKLKYNYSYVASRYFAEITLSKNMSIEYLIDIHRDSTRLEGTLYKKDGKEYARILFVIGLDHVNYHKNLDLSTKLNNFIKKDYPGISRGILKKSGKNVNGIYNQDLSPNSILIEIGGVDNTIEQVYNTCEVLAKKISEYIKGVKNGT